MFVGRLQKLRLFWTTGQSRNIFCLFLTLSESVLFNILDDFSGNNSQTENLSICPFSGFILSKFSETVGFLYKSSSKTSKKSEPWQTFKHHGDDGRSQFLSSVILVKRILRLSGVMSLMTSHRCRPLSYIITTS